MTTTRATETFRRFRRLRSSEAMRSLVRETRLSPAGFVYPLFITHGEGVRSEIASMPGQYQLSIDEAFYSVLRRHYVDGEAVFARRLGRDRADASD